MTQPGSGGLGKSRANVIMRPRRLVPLLKLAVAEQHHPERSLPPQSTHCGTEGDPRAATAGARLRDPPPTRVHAPPTKGRWRRRRG